MVDLLVEFAPWRVHIYILPCCSTAAATMLNLAGDGAQFARSRCSIPGGILTNIEKCESNTTLDVLCPLLELLEIDPREALCPTMTQESPSHFQFRTLIDNCSEQEAAALLAVCEAVLGTMRGRISDDIKE